MKFFGNGIVWDGQNNKPLCEFKDGIYETENTREIAILEEQGFKYEGELKIKLDKKTEEINILKTKLAEAEKLGDPKILAKLEERLIVEEEKSKKLEERLAENDRAADIIRNKAVELKFAKKKDIEDLSLLELCEVFVAKLEGAEDPKGE